MLKILTRADYADQSYEEMLRGRAKTFGERLNWSVAIRDGKEFDSYDQDADPIYLTALDERGHVAGSLRLLPTTGPTMLKREFRNMFQEPADVDGPTTWECTRFCVHPQTSIGAHWPRSVAVQLLSGLCDLALRSGIENIVGVYDAPMERVYRRLGWSPSLLSRSWPQLGSFCCGLWHVNPEIGNLLRCRVKESGLEPLHHQLSVASDAGRKPHLRWRYSQG
ncbi:acyl-homoserine-lactone synthase [Sinorhizobium meliloti]|nr:acyl-homoserine-lactone synthase [Sinorhizobium meliloti]WKL30113.1 acyl-homoserine-lactone synthase [Sinorhizobium meliloti]WKL35733.1 acyl-homoserine-lactone synthase [Sinorhizobium meliloti]